LKLPCRETGLKLNFATARKCLAVIAIKEGDSGRRRQLLVKIETGIINFAFIAKKNREAVMEIVKT